MEKNQKKILQAALWIACLTIAAFLLAQASAVIMNRSFDAVSMNVPVISTEPPERDAPLPPRHQASEGKRSSDIKESGADCSVKMERVSETQWIVDRASLPGNNRDLNRLLMQARAVPSMNQGRIVGFRITRISRGSLYEKAGLRNGDVLLRANTKKLDNPSKLLSIYQEMKKQSHISLLLFRNGQNRTFEYEIR